ncbi:MAG: YkgJ family cysteine cluster protein [Gammaproteobacteria bacterium]|nr:YkgJ family cysteine cluster protein [Gammaproteobacteria bacterium]
MKECNQCGKCCTNYSNGGLSASASEIEYWEIHRPEIFRYVHDGLIWMCPDTGKQLTLCPWLKKLPNQNKYTCDIYFNRPDDCRHYPVTIEDMINDQCEMLEPLDFANLKQAQKSLNLLMSDSRPPFE